MARLQVPLKGVNWKLPIIFYFALIAATLTVVEIRRPGTIAAIPAAIKHGSLRIYDLSVDVIKSAMKFLREISR